MSRSAWQTRVQTAEEDRRYVSRELAEQGKIKLENAIRRSAVACYAAEGAYPPDVDYLIEHYGLSVDESRYIVHYDIFAENLMPDITVLT